MAGTHRRVLVRGGIALAVVVAIFVGVLPQLADLSSALSRVGAMSGLELAALATMAVVVVVASAVVLMSVMPGLSLAQAVVVHQSSTAVANTMPAGGLLGVGMSYRFYGSWGYARTAITANVVLTGIGNVMCKVAFPVVALALLATGGEASRNLVLAAVVGLSALLVAIAGGIVALASERGAHRVGEVIGGAVGWVRRQLRRAPRGNGGEAAVRFRRQAIGVLRHRGGRLTGTMLTFYVAQFALFFVALRAVGVTPSQVGGAEALAAYSIAGLLGVLPVTPGGVGLVELGLAGALIAAGAPNAEAVAAALVFRSTSFFLAVPLGAVTYFVWRFNSRWRSEPGSRPTFAAP